MWTVMFVNSALVLLLINANYIRVPLPANSPVLRGPFKDFNTEWCGPVGATIAIPTIINAVTPLGNLGYLMQYHLKRCWDRGCSCNMKKTKSLLQSSYEQTYTGPEFTIASRYAVLIAMIFIIMMYSTAIPLMYACGFLIFFLSYWTDKILFLRLYKVPPRYGLHLAFGTQIVMEWSILLHLFTGIYMISNPDIFNFNDSEKVKSHLLQRYGTVVSHWWNWLFGTDHKRLE